MKNPHFRLILPVLLLAAAICLIVVGVLRGEVAEVYTKARLICLECIGIG